VSSPRGAGRNGAAREPRLEPGPPIVGAGLHHALFESERPFKLSLGQWKYVFRQIEVHRRVCAGGIETPSPKEEGSEDGTPTNKPFFPSAEDDDDLSLASLLAEQKSLGAKSSSEDEAIAAKPLAKEGPKGRLGESALGEVVAALAVRMGSLESDMAAADQRLVENKSRTVLLEDEITRLRETNRQLKGIIKTAHGMVRDVKAELGKVVQPGSRNTLSAPRTINTGVDPEVVNDLSGRVHAVEHTLSDPQGRLHQVLARMRELEDQMAMGGGDFGGR
jgi:hypothetical protein